MKKLLLKETIKMREEDFGILIFNPDNFSTFVIDNNGRRLLDLCDNSCSLSEILSLIRPIDNDILDNVGHFLKNLISLGIIREVDNNG
ncbi:MAG: hypothetical protein ABIC36_00995 [bacterium]